MNCELCLHWQISPIQSILRHSRAVCDCLLCLCKYGNRDKWATLKACTSASQMHNLQRHIALISCKDIKGGHHFTSSKTIIKARECGMDHCTIYALAQLLQAGQDTCRRAARTLMWWPYLSSTSPTDRESTMTFRRCVLGRKTTARKNSSVLSSFSSYRSRQAHSVSVKSAQSMNVVIKPGRACSWDAWDDFMDSALLEDW